MQDKVRVSVIVPSHNDEKYIESCLRSVMAQTVEPFEVLICDDSSTDGTRAIIGKIEKRYSGKVRVVRHDVNIGCGSNFNSGIRLAKGSHISIVAADDWWLPNKLEAELKRLKDTGCRWAYSTVELGWEDGPHAGSRTPFWGTEAAREGDIFENVLLRRISPRNFLIEKSLLEEMGGFDEGFGMYEDWDLKLRISAHYPIAFEPAVGVVYRQHGAGISRANSERQMMEAGKVLRKNADLISQRLSNRAEDLRNQAFRCLLPAAPGSETVEAREIPDWLNMDYTPRLLNRRGAGLIFIAGGTQSPALVQLKSHPDVVCPGADYRAHALLRPLFNDITVDDDDLVAISAYLYSSYRNLLLHSGKSRVLVQEVLSNSNQTVLQRMLPDATFISVSDGAGHSYAQLCRQLGLPMSAECGHRVVSLNAQGEEKFAQGDYSGAEQLFHDAMAIDPNYTVSYNNLGVVRWQIGDPAGALKSFADGLEQNPQDRDLLRNTIQLLSRLGHLRDAEDLYNQYVSIYSDDSDLAGLIRPAAGAAG